MCQLQDEEFDFSCLFCPYCAVDGELTYDNDLRKLLQDMNTTCPYVTKDGHQCSWNGLYSDFWRHVHIIDLSRKRSASEEDENEDGSPAAKRLVVRLCDLISTSIDAALDVILTGMRGWRGE